MEAEVPAYPVQNRLTGPMRAAGAKAGDAEVLSLWAGQAFRLAQPGDPADLVHAWWAEAKAVSAALADSIGRR